jgi:hypothetical protein
MKRPLVTAMNPAATRSSSWAIRRCLASSSRTPSSTRTPPCSRPPPSRPAKEFFTIYLTQKFGKLPEFRILGAGPNPRLDEIVGAAAKRLGVTGQITTTLIAFDYRDNGKLIRSLVNGMTLRNNGGTWVADLSGISSTDDPIKYHGLLLG